MTEAKEIIEVLGVKYEERPKKKTNHSSRMMKFLLATAMIMGGMTLKSRSIAEIDIIEEFKLIQEKKSKLSRKDREWVEYQFHKNFIIVNPQPNE